MAGQADGKGRGAAARAGRTLVLGGTGPSGPLIVEGLVARGHQVTVLHGGQHEVPLPAAVEHLHGDIHFREALDGALGNRTFDLVIATYGRLRGTAEWLAGRTPRLIAVGTAASLAPPRDPRWGPMGRPVIVPDHDRIPADPAAGGCLVDPDQPGGNVWTFTYDQQGATATEYLAQLDHCPRPPAGRWSRRPIGGTGTAR